MPIKMAITKYLRITSYVFLGCIAACAVRRIPNEIDAKWLPQDGAGANPHPIIVQPEPTQPRSEAPTLSAANPVPAVTIEKPTEHFTIPDDQGRIIDVYPPISKEERAPFVVLLHATCMQPAWVCDWFGSAGRDTGWLVCPSGNSTCYGEPDWHGPGPQKAAFLEQALRKVEASVSTFVNDEPGVLIGWSRGAFAARDILYASLEDEQSFPHAKRFRGLVLMAAAVKPDVAKLQQVGIKRVVMAAGDYDGSKSVMLSAVAALRAGGIEARYVSFGKIAHVWPNDFEVRMREPIAWAGQAPQ